VLIFCPILIPLFLGFVILFCGTLIVDIITLNRFDLIDVNEPEEKK